MTTPNGNKPISLNSPHSYDSNDGIYMQIRALYKEIRKLPDLLFTHFGEHLDLELYLVLYLVRKVFTRRIQRRWNDVKRFNGCREMTKLSGGCLGQGGGRSVHQYNHLRTAQDIG